MDGLFGVVAVGQRQVSSEAAVVQNGRWCLRNPHRVSGRWPPPRGGSPTGASSATRAAANLTSCAPAEQHSLPLEEWFMVCAAADYPAFISGWEFPGQMGVPDARRRFEVLWSVDPPAVRDAALICAQIARALSPSLDRPLDELPDGVPPPASADLHRAIGLFNRMASYLDKGTDQ